jgi:aspartyl-tRNA(Asn)/glutamyl-tRNA(Gln) amidotransferase subunit A
LKALEAQKQLKADLEEVYNEYDAILSPTSPEVAWRIGEKVSDPLKMYLSDLYTVPANLA